MQVIMLQSCSCRQAKYTCGFQSHMSKSLQVVFFASYDEGLAVLE